MIFTETREGRRFVGEIPPGTPLMAALRQLTERYRIDSGWMVGAGLIRDAQLRTVAADGELGEPVSHPGAATLTSLQVSISHKQGQRHVQAWVALHGGEGPAAGLLEEAVSGSVEVMAWTFDDITLRRFEDAQSGLWRWLDVGVNVVGGGDAPARSGRLAMEALPSRLLEPEEMPQLKVGDALQHPALGFCVVTQVYDQDRVAIQVETGKVAQLHLGVLKLQRAGQRDGRTVYEVQVRRRT